MAINDFPSLKTAVTNWMSRGDVAGEAEEFISLAEAGLNRELNPVEIDVTLTGATGSREIDITSQSCVEPIALFLAQTGLNEIELAPMTAGTFAFQNTSGAPRFWSISEDHIVFDRPLDQDYPFRFRFRQRFGLSDTATTNWLLTYHPDVYLAACLIWGGVFVQDDPAAARWVTLLNTALPSVRNSIAQSKRAIATVDRSMPTTRNGRGLPWAWRNEI